jgi:hypothetical protein
MSDTSYDDVPVESAGGEWPDDDEAASRTSPIVIDLEDGEKA